MLLNRFTKSMLAKYLMISILSARTYSLYQNYAHYFKNDLQSNCNYLINLLTKGDKNGSKTLCCPHNSYGVHMNTR